MPKALKGKGAMASLVGRHVGPFKPAGGPEMDAPFSILTASSVLFDAVYVPGGDAAIAALKNEPQAIEFLVTAFKHYKPIAASGAGAKLLTAAGITGAKPNPEGGPDANPLAGVVTPKGKNVTSLFIAAIAQHRHGARGLKPPIPMPMA